MSTLENETYSARVSGHLIVNGHALRLSHVGPDSCLVRNPEDHPPTSAQIVLNIDGHERTREVFLIDGISRESKVVRFAGADESLPSRF